MKPTVKITLTDEDGVVFEIATIKTDKLGRLSAIDSTGDEVGVEELIRAALTWRRAGQDR